MKLSELLEIIGKKTAKTSQWDDPDFLSDLLLELASYYATLGPFVAQTDQETDLAKAYYEIKEAKFIKDAINNSQAVARAEVEARVDSEVDRKAYIDRKYNAKLVFVARQSLDKTMDAIRSRLSYLKSDKEGSKHGV